MDPMFLDLEASSLDPEGWPVEVGLAWIERGAVRSAARLIRPHPGWSMRAWSPESAAVHGIALAALREAEPAEAVARWVERATLGHVLVSDAPAWDAAWLRRLLSAAGLPAPRLVDYDRLVASRFDMAGVRRVYAALDTAPVPHRAGPDAERLARAWLAGASREGEGER